jgi:copper resistance protein B
MSAFRVVPLAAALIALATAAAAQTSGAKDEPTLGMEPIQPVMDRPVLAHVIFNQLEGRWNGSNTQFRWEGQGWVGTDYDKLWIKSEGTLQSNGTLDDGQHQFLYDRAMTTYFDLQGGLRKHDVAINWLPRGKSSLEPSGAAAGGASRQIGRFVDAP